MHIQTYDVNDANRLSNKILNNVHGFIETFNGFGVIEIFDFAQHFYQYSSMWDIAE